MYYHSGNGGYRSVWLVENLQISQEIKQLQLFVFFYLNYLLKYCEMFQLFFFFAVAKRYYKNYDRKCMHTCIAYTIIHKRSLLDTLLLYVYHVKMYIPIQYHIIFIPPAKVWQGIKDNFLCENVNIHKCHTYIFFSFNLFLVLFFR